MPNSSAKSSSNGSPDYSKVMELLQNMKIPDENFGQISSAILNCALEYQSPNPKVPTSGSKGRQSRTSPREARITPSLKPLSGCKSKSPELSKFNHFVLPHQNSSSSMATTEPTASYGSFKSPSPFRSHNTLPYNGSQSKSQTLESALDKLSSTVISTGSIHSGDRLLNYTIREFSGMCLSLNIYVPSTQQTWSLFLPIIDTVIPLRRLWAEKEATLGTALPNIYDKPMETRHNDLIGKWILSCATLEFDGSLITAAHFDHDSFKNRYNSELMHCFQSAASRMILQGGSQSVKYPRIDREHNVSGDESRPRGRAGGRADSQSPSPKSSPKRRNETRSKSKSPSRSPSPQRVAVRPPFGRMSSKKSPVPSQQNGAANSSEEQQQKKKKKKTVSPDDQKSKKKRSPKRKHKPEHFVSSPTDDLRIGMSSFPYPFPYSNISHGDSQTINPYKFLGSQLERSSNDAIGVPIQHSSSFPLSMSISPSGPSQSQPSLHDLVAPEIKTLAYPYSSHSSTDDQQLYKSISENCITQSDEIHQDERREVENLVRAASTGMVNSPTAQLSILTPGHHSADSFLQSSDHGCSPIIQSLDNRNDTFHTKNNNHDDGSLGNNIVSIQSELSDVMTQMSLLKERAGTQRLELHEAQLNIKGASVEGIEKLIATSEKMRQDRSYKSSTLNQGDTASDPYAAMAAAAAAAAVATSEALFSSRFPQPHSPSRLDRHQYYQSPNSLEYPPQTPGRNLVAESKTLSQSILIQALQDEIATLNQLRDKQLLEFQDEKTKALDDLQKQKEMELMRVVWEKEQLLLEREQELQSLQMIQQLELQALNRASEREVKSLEDLVQREERMVKEQADEAERLKKLADDERRMREQAQVDAKRAQEAELRLIEEAQRRELAAKEDQLDRLREAAEVATMDREAALNQILVKQFHDEQRQKEAVLELQSQILPIKRENELLVEMLDTVCGLKADEALFAAYDPIFAIFLHELCLLADYLPEETDEERVIRKRFERLEAESERKLKLESERWAKQQAKVQKELEDILLLKQNDIEGLRHLLEVKEARLVKVEGETMLKDEEFRKQAEQFTGASQLSLIQARLSTVAELEVDIASKSTFSKTAIKRLREEKERLQAMEKALLEGGVIGEPFEMPVRKASDGNIIQKQSSVRFADSTRADDDDDDEGGGDDETEKPLSNTIVSPPNDTSTVKSFTHESSLGENTNSNTSNFRTISSSKVGIMSPSTNVSEPVAIPTAAIPVPDGSSEKKRFSFVSLSRKLVVSSKVSTVSTKDQHPETMTSLSDSSAAESTNTSGGYSISSKGLSTKASYDISPMLADSLSESTKIKEVAINNEIKAQKEQTPVPSSKRLTAQDRIARLKLAVTHHSAQLEDESPELQRAALIRVAALLRTVETSSDVRLLNMALETSLQSHALELGKKCLIRINSLVEEHDKDGKYFDVELSYFFKVIILCCDEAGLMQSIVDTIFLIVARGAKVDGFDEIKWLDFLSVCGIFDTLAVVLNHHPRDPIMCFKGLKCLFKLTQTHRSNRVRLSRDSTYVEILKKMAKDHRSNSAVLDPLLRVLVNMTTDCSEGVAVLVADDAASALLRLMKIHVKSEKLVTVICRVLINISVPVDKNLQNTIAMAGATFVIALDFYRMKLKMLDVLCWVILGAVVENDDAKHLLLDSGILTILLTIIKMENVQEQTQLFLIKAMTQLIDPSYAPCKDINMEILKLLTSYAIRRGTSELKTRAGIAIEKVFGNEGLERKEKEHEFAEAQKVILTSAMQQEAALVLKNIADAKERAFKAKAAADEAIEEEFRRQQQDQLWRMKEEAEEALKLVAEKERKAREAAEQQLRDFQEIARREKEKLDEHRKILDIEKKTVTDEKIRIEKIESERQRRAELEELARAMGGNLKANINLPTLTPAKDAYGNTILINESELQSRTELAMLQQRIADNNPVPLGGSELKILNDQTPSLVQSSDRDRHMRNRKMEASPPSITPAPVATSSSSNQDRTHNPDVQKALGLLKARRKSRDGL